MLLRCILLAAILRYAHASNDSRESEDKLPRVIIGSIFDRDAFMRKAFSLALRTVNECVFKTDFCELLQACQPEINCAEFHMKFFGGVVYEVDDDIINVNKIVGEVFGNQLEQNNVKEVVSHKKGLAAVIGPHFDLSSPYVHGLLDMHDVPNIVIKRRMEPEPFRAINVYPEHDTLMTVYSKMIDQFNWTAFSILYERTDDFVSMERLLKYYSNKDWGGVIPWDHKVYAFRLGSGPNYSEPLLIAKEQGHKNLVLDCSSKSLPVILQHIQQVGMMTEAYKYIVTNLDLQTIDLRAYRHSGVEMIGFRIYNPTDPMVYEFVNNHLEDFGIESVDKLKTEEALMFDAIALFTQAYKDLTYDFPIEQGAELNETYDSLPKAWIHGLSLRNYILYNEINGLTGPVMLDTDGIRRRFRLDVLSLRKEGLNKVGMWNPDDGFDATTHFHEIKSTHFNIIITLNAPYASLVNFSKNAEGNERYEGYVVDIVKALSKEIGFNYTFYVQYDSQNGDCFKDEYQDCRCNGMLEKILSKEMDMAITDLTITENRESCVGFSTAFHNLGVQILYKKPKKETPTWYSFLSPFHYEVWLYLAGVYIMISIVFFCIGRLSPYEWTNPYPCIEEPDNMENQFTLNNSFWFTMGAIMQQGSEIAPIASSTRTLAGFWWFFCLIIVSSYTANLAAFLTIETPVTIVKGVDDLINQTKIKYGAKKGGSTFKYFQGSKNHKYQELGRTMEEQDEKWMPDTNDKGVELVKKENYAFLMESSTIEYVEGRVCDVLHAGDLIDHKSYAIAFAKDFPHAKAINTQVSKLLENDELKGLYTKWWKEKGVICEKKDDSDTEPMGLDQTKGIFYVLGYGILISCILTSYEFFYGAKSAAKKEDVSLMETISAEVRSLKKMKAVKPTLKKQRSGESNLSSQFSCDLTMSSFT